MDDAADDTYGRKRRGRLAERLCRGSCVPPGRGRETGIPGRDGNQPGV